MNDISEWAQVRTVAGGTARVRAHCGAIHVDGLSWAFMTPAQWDALAAAGNLLAAGIRGRKVLELASEAGGMALLTLASDVEDCLQEAVGLDDVTDAQWLKVAGVLDRPGGSYALLKELWDAAGKGQEEDSLG